MKLEKKNLSSHFHEGCTAVHSRLHTQVSSPENMLLHLPGSFFPFSVFCSLYYYFSFLRLALEDIRLPWWLRE